MLIPKVPRLPLSVKWFTDRDVGQDWREETRDFFHEAHEVTFRFSESAAPHECPPLENTCGLVPIFETNS